MNSGNKHNKQLIIDNERKAMFLPMIDKQSNRRILNKTNDLLLNVFDDKKIFYNSNIKINIKV
jgi:hypothetical protein